MHVGFVVTNYPPHSGGVEQHLATLTRLLVERSVACTVVCLDTHPSVRLDAGVRVHTLRRRLDLGQVVALPEPLAWRRLTAELRGSALTHVSTHTRFFPMSLLGVRLARRFQVPSVHTEHGAGHVRTGRRGIDEGSRLVDRTMGRRVLRSATEVLAVSERSAEFVRALSGRPATAFGNGIELARWRRPTPMPPQPRLVFVGRLAGEKGWADFLEVVRANREVPGLRGVVVGAGPDAVAVRRSVVAMGLVSQVELRGELAQPDVARTLAGAVYVNPSRAAEGFQLTQLEAAAAGAQSVTYDVGVARELKAAGAPVTVVPVGDVGALSAAARTALTDPRPVATAEALAPWDWPALADRYVEVLERLHGTT